jgi:hypothetical protein
MPSLAGVGTCVAAVARFGKYLLHLCSAVGIGINEVIGLRNIFLEVVQRILLPIFAISTDITSPSVSLSRISI